MYNYLDCLSCVVRQVAEAERNAGMKESVQIDVMKQVLRTLADMDMTEGSSAMVQKVFNVVREVGGVNDPLENIKSYCMDIALRAYPELQHTLDESEDRFETAVRIAMAGNIIDHHIREDRRLDNLALFRSIEDALSRPLVVDHVDLLEKEIHKASKILYLADNAGETVFDRILIEEMPKERIIYAVKRMPVSTDATIRDAAMAGLTDLVQVFVIDTDYPCVFPDKCPEAFQRLFNSADLIIAKGQGNMKALSDQDRNIFFLARIRCKVTAAKFKLSVGDFLVKSLKAGDG